MGLIGLFRDLQSQHLEHRATFTRTQRCRRCGIATEVSVEAVGAGLARPAGLLLDAEDVAEGHRDAESAASRNAWVSLQLAQCVSCNRRGWLAHPLAILVTPHWTIAGAILGAFAALFGALTLGANVLIGAALGLGYAVARRLGQADRAVRRS